MLCQHQNDRCRCGQCLWAAIAWHHQQHADDLCWLDNDELYAAAGLPAKDYGVGDKAEMRKNCDRFINNVCQDGGRWVSYAQLERQRDSLIELVNAVRSSELSWNLWLGRRDQVLREIEAENAKAAVTQTTLATAGQ